MSRRDMSPGSIVVPSNSAVVRYLIIGGVVWFGFCAFIAIILVPPDNGVWTETFKAIGVAAAVAGGLFSPIASIATARYQKGLTADLESLKTDYTKEVERLKNSLSAGLEVKKALIAGKVRAFDAMLTSAHFYYFVIRQQTYDVLEKTDSLLAEADKKAADASSVVWHLEKDDRLKWFSVYQKAITLSGLLKEASTDKLITTFNSHAGELGEAIETLEAAGRAAFEEADKYQLKLAEDEFRVFGRTLDR